MAIDPNYPWGSRPDRVDYMTPAEKSREMYILGDKIGAPAEGGAGGSCSWERAIQGLRAHPLGTDESDTASMFEWYCRDYPMTSHDDILNWHRYHAIKHRATTYGKTWRDHFATVKAMDKKGELSILRLLAISADRNSFGNGVLALVFPAMVKNIKPEIYNMIFATTHYQAAPTATLMVEALRRRDIQQIEEIIYPIAHAWKDSPGRTPHYLYCIAAAYEVAKQPTIHEGIRWALQFGGDVDSFLAFGLMMWAWLGDCLGDRNSEKQIDAFIRACEAPIGSEEYQSLVSPRNV